MFNHDREAPRALALLVVGLLSTVLSVANPATAQTASDTERRSQISWQACNQDRTAQTGVAYECATVAAPLDYDRPNGATISVELVRIPASDPTNRIGSILFNPGGPGGSGVDFVLDAGPFLGALYGPEIPRRFDLIGFDPRGIARSTPIRCYRTLAEAIAAAHPAAFPITTAEEAAFAATDIGLARNCARRAGPIGQHMSTANVARDMNLIRRRLGEDQISFVGLSYGTYLGATYANMFPGRVRSFVVDGVLDPVRWVNARPRVPFSTALRSDEGAQETLAAFFDLCEAAQPGTQRQPAFRRSGGGNPGAAPNVDRPRDRPVVRAPVPRSDRSGSGRPVQPVRLCLAGPVPGRARIAGIHAGPARPGHAHDGRRDGRSSTPP
jgi:pimeloyl-ACP methyl ester carboxylesterase